MKNEDIFFIIWIILVVFMITAFCIMGKKALSIFPSLSSEDIVYKDYFASGYSTQSTITELGGATKILHIIVTKEELWIKSSLIFAGIINFYDLLNKINLNDIMSISKNKKKIIINFKTNLNTNKQIVIITRNQDEFLNALKLSVGENIKR